VVRSTINFKKCVSVIDTDETTPTRMRTNSLVAPGGCSTTANHSSRTDSSALTLKPQKVANAESRAVAAFLVSSSAAVKSRASCSSSAVDAVPAGLVKEWTGGAGTVNG